MNGITEDWKITELEYYSELQGLSKVVKKVNWAIVTDASAIGGTRYVGFGQTCLPLPADATFTPFENLTEEQVKSWIVENLSASQLAEFRSNAAQYVVNTLNLPSEIATDVVWVNSSLELVPEAAPPAPLPPEEAQSLAVRNGRNTLLAGSDWTQLSDVPQSVKDLWAPYRQALRDMPAQAGFPFNVIWPASPQ